MWMWHVSPILQTCFDVLWPGEAAVMPLYMKGREYTPKVAPAVHRGVTAGAFRHRAWGAKSGDGARQITNDRCAIDRT